MDCALAMWAVWAAVIFIFFSLSVSKLPNYLLPAFPALAVVCSARLEAIAKSGWRLSRLEPAIIGSCGGLFGALALTIGVLGWQWRSSSGAPSATAKALGRFVNWKEQTDSVDVLWQKLAPLTESAPLWIALGVLLLMVSILVAASWRDVRRVVVCAVLTNLSLVIVIVHLLAPAWARREIVPVNNLAQLTAPGLAGREMLILYRLHPNRVSVRYLLGHEDQIVETASPEFLERSMTNSGRGYILTTSDVRLPFSEEVLHPVTTDEYWRLWRYER